MRGMYFFYEHIIVLWTTLYIGIRLSTVTFSGVCAFNAVMPGRKVLREKEITSSLVGGAGATPARSLKCIT